MTPDRWRRAQEVFVAATERESGSRATFLEEACRNDPELRKEVESLLSSFDAAPSGFLESPAIEGVPTLPPTSRAVGKGTHLGPYEILASLGAGGMGEVYRARDERLGREVAIKVLPAEWSSDASRVKRFEQEARSASALNHPNIVTVYDTGSSDGVAWIAMERVEGATLRELVNGPIAIKRLLSIATQVTDGLAKAHEAGIVHRDLKPENVMVTKDGLVKILDFGLAKLTAKGSGSGEDSKLPTMTGTTPGVIFGTVGYMSPEQAGGEAVDFRSDQFSFGSILYEMVTGKRAFQRKTAIDTLGAILNEEPPSISSISPQAPTQLRWIVERCLAKEPRQRYSSTDDLARDLATLRDHLSEATSGAAPANRASRRLRRPALLGVFALLLLAAGAVFQWTQRQRPTKQALKVRQLTSNSAENPVGTGELSPDGKYLAYTDKGGMKIKLIDSDDVRVVPEPEAFKGRERIWEIGPWYPDSTKFIATSHSRGWDAQGPNVLGTSIWAVLVMGGAPRKLHDDADVYSVSPDGSSIAFGTNSGKFGDREVWLMGPSGERAHKLYDADANSGFVAFAWFRSGRRVAYCKVDESGPRVLSRDLNGGPVTTILPSKAVDQITTTKINSMAWSPDGRLIYSLPETEPGSVASESDNFWELPIDPHTGEVLSEPRRLTSWTGFGVSASGSIADAKRLAFRKWTNQNTVYLAPLEAGGTAMTSPRHFTLSESGSWAADWTADSKTLLFVSNRNGHDGIYRQSLSDESPELVVMGPENSIDNACVSPDGAWVVYQTSPASGASAPPMQVMRTPMAGGTSQLVLTARPNSWFRCARSSASLCAVEEPAENRKQLIFTAFDPVKGRGSELLRVDTDPNNNRPPAWSLSPDGTRIAFCLSPKAPIHILSSHGQPIQEIRVKGWSSVESLSWTADGKALFVGTELPETAILLHVDLQGNAQVLWQQLGSHWMNGVPSPDGRLLAITASGTGANMWMMENF